MPNRNLDPATLHGISDAETAIQRACEELDRRIQAKGYRCEPTTIVRGDNLLWRVVICITNAKPFLGFIETDNSPISVHRNANLRTAVEQAARAVRRLPAAEPAKAVRRGCEVTG